MKKRWKGITLVEVLLAVSMSAIVVAVAYTVLQSALQQVGTTTADVDLRVEKRILQQTLQADLQYSSVFTSLEGGKSWSLKSEKGTEIIWAYDENKDTVTRKEGINQRDFLSGEVETFSLTPETTVSSNGQKYTVTLKVQGKSESSTISSRNRTLVRSVVETLDTITLGNELIYFDLLTGGIKFNDNLIKKYYYWENSALTQVDLKAVKWIRIAKNGNQDDIDIFFYDAESMKGKTLPITNGHYPPYYKRIVFDLKPKKELEEMPLYFQQSGGNEPFLYFLNMSPTQTNPRTFAVINDTQNDLVVKFQNDKTKTISKNQNNFIYVTAGGN